MPIPKTLTTVRNDLATLFDVGAVGCLTDAELLEWFSNGRGDSASDAAFAMIVERHGPMVLGVCRRLLGDEHAAADAFQATFLILARKARTVRVEDSLGRWLYGVSVRVARRAKSVVLAERSRVQGLEGIDPPDEAASPDPVWRDELRTVIDEEVVRLPVRYRSAVVLCYLEGLTQEQAAPSAAMPRGHGREPLAPGAGAAPVAVDPAQAWPLRPEGWRHSPRRRRERRCLRSYSRRHSPSGSAWQKAVRRLGRSRRRLPCW